MTARASAPTNPGGRRLGSSLLFVVVAAIAVASLALAAHRAAYRGRIQPSVRIGDVDVGGLTIDQASSALISAGLDPAAPVVLSADGALWSVEPSAAGVTFDLTSTLGSAYAVGRRGALAPLTAALSRFRPTTVRPVVAIDREAATLAVEHLADGFDEPAANASLVLEGSEVRETPARPGRALNVDGSVAALAAAASSGEWPINGIALPHNRIEPEVASAADAVDQARRLIEAPVVLRFKELSWTLEPPVLASMLTTEDSGDRVELSLDEARFDAWLEPVMEAISTTARAPRFDFDPTSEALELASPGIAGQIVDAQQTARRVLDASEQPGRTVQVYVESVPPPVADNMTATELGIRELVWEETSRYAGSPSGRMHNIALATQQFDGLLVPPDAVFSFNDNVGDISPQAGYEETLIIMDGSTTDGVGGGVCQVSTTLFRTALRAGLPIVERYPHGYRVAYYEQGADPGLDATVYSPVVDLKFRNDTGSWLLIDTETDTAAATVTFRFYGARPDREVEILPAVVTDIVPPPPARLVVDPELPAGRSEVLEYSRSGASVSVTRLIREGGEERSEVYYSRYRPTGLVTAVSGQAAGQTPPESGVLVGGTGAAADSTGATSPSVVLTPTP